MKELKTNEEMRSYVEACLKFGAKPFAAKKASGLMTAHIKSGESFTVYTDAGVEVEESVLQEGNVAVINLDADGKIMLTKDGHMNIYQISKDTLSERYETDPTVPGTFVAKGEPRTLIKTIEDLTLHKEWGNQVLYAGSYLAIDNMNDIYGIEEEAFNKTYKVVDGNTQRKLPSKDFDEYQNDGDECDY